MVNPKLSDTAMKAAQAIVSKICSGDHCDSPKSGVDEVFGAICDATDSNCWGESPGKIGRFVSIALNPFGSGHRLHPPSAYSVTSSRISVQERNRQLKCSAHRQAAQHRCDIYDPALSDWVKAQELAYQPFNRSVDPKGHLPNWKGTNKNPLDLNYDRDHQAAKELQHCVETTSGWAGYHRGAAREGLHLFSSRKSRIRLVRGFQFRARVPKATGEHQKIQEATYNGCCGEDRSLVSARVILAKSDENIAPHRSKPPTFIFPHPRLLRAVSVVTLLSSLMFSACSSLNPKLRVLGETLGGGITGASLGAAFAPNDDNRAINALVFGLGTALLAGGVAVWLMPDTPKADPTPDLRAREMGLAPTGTQYMVHPDSELPEYLKQRVQPAVIEEFEEKDSISDEGTLHEPHRAYRIKRPAELSANPISGPTTSPTSRPETGAVP